MHLDHGAAIRGIHEELVLLRELLLGEPPPPRASLPASAATALRTPSIGPFPVETTEKMLTVHMQLRHVSHLLFQRKPSAYLYACQDQVSCIQ
jgi:hypothetical protein